MGSRVRRQARHETELEFRRRPTDIAPTQYVRWPGRETDDRRPRSTRTSQNLWSKAERTLDDRDRQTLQFGSVDKETIAAEVLRLVQGKYQEQARKRWTFTRSNGDVVELRTIFTKVADHVQKFIDIGDVVNSYHQAHFALPWAGLSINNIRTYGAVAEALQIVSFALTKCAQIEASLSPGRSQHRTNLTERLKNLYAAVLIFLCRMRRSFDRRGPARLIVGALGDPASTVDQYLLPIIDGLDKVENFIQSTDGIDTRQAFETTQRDVTPHQGAGLNVVSSRLDIIVHSVPELRQSHGGQAKSAINVKERETLLQVLDGPSTTQDFEDARDIRLPETCAWFWQCTEFTSWLTYEEQEPTTKTLWVHAPAGFGKTILCAATVQMLLGRPEFQVAYFFCKDQGNSERQSQTDSILRSWLNQLLRGSEELLEYAASLPLTQRKAPLTLGDQWLLLTKIVHRARNCVLVVDGLDECDGVDPRNRHDETDLRMKFLKFVARAIKGSGCKLLLTSRYNASLQSVWSYIIAEDPKHLVYTHEITTSDTALDVVICARDIVDNKLHNKSQEMRNQISDAVASKCQGMFLWARLVGHELTPGKNGRELRETVQQYPPGLESTYEREIKHIQNLSPRDSNRAFSILRWVLGAMRPLRVCELTEALIAESLRVGQHFPVDELPDSWDKEYVQDRILSLCGSLLQIKSAGTETSLENSTIQFVHFSAKEFLLKYAHDSSTAGTVSLAMKSPDLEESCLRYLLLQNFCHGRKVTQAEVETHLKDRPFLSYAATFWHPHISRRLIPSATSLQLIDSLFSPNEHRWYTWSAVFELGLTRLEDSSTGEKQTPDFERCQASALYYCSLLGLKSTASWLLDRGYNVNEPGGRFGTPLQAAVFEGRAAVVELLLRNNANVEMEDGQFGFPIVAVGANPYVPDQQDILASLLSHGAKVTSSDSEGNFALHFAAAAGMLRISAGLLAAASREMDESQDRRTRILNPANKRGWTPLHAAAKTGDVEMIELLTSFDLDVTVQDERKWTTVFAAAAHGHLDAVRHLIRLGADPHAVNESGWTALHAAAESGSLATVQLLREHGVSVFSVNNDGATPLHGASLAGHSGVVEYLVADYPDLDLSNENGWTALHAAAWNGHLDVVRILLDKGADIERKDKKGWRALHLAAQNGHEHVVAHLLGRRAEIICASENGWSPLHNACAYGEIVSAQILLDGGADIEAVDNEQQTPLLLAARSAKEASVRFLVEKSAQVNASGSNQFSAIHYAASRGSLELFRYLVDKGADTALKGVSDLTVLHAASIAGNFEVARFLVQRGATINPVASDKSLPIHFASSAGFSDIVELLFDNGGDIHAKSEGGATPLHMAASSGHLALVDFLVQKDARVNELTMTGATPLYMAALDGRADVVSYLLAEGASFSDHTQSGWTPLMASVLKGDLAIINMLLERGAEVNDRTTEEQTPLAIAIQLGHAEVVDRLLANGADSSSHDREGLSPLHLAANAGSLQMTTSLVANHANVNAETTEGSTPLYSASLKGHVAIVDHLLTHSATAQPSRETKYLPLYAAAIEGHTEVVKLLFNHGALPNVPRNDGFTPLYGASLNGHVEIVSFLLEKGANCDAEVEEGFTALYAAVQAGHTETVQCLLGANAKVITAHDGSSALTRGLVLGHTDIVAKLLEYGADASQPDSEGWSQIHNALLNGFLEIAKDLVAHGADLRAYGPDGTSSLHQAVMSGHLETVQWLLQLDMDPNATDPSLWTPLMILAATTNFQKPASPHELSDSQVYQDASEAARVATQEQYSALARCLVDHGASLNQQMKDGRTALHIAVANRNIPALRALLALGADPGVGDCYQSTSLHLACYTHDLESAAALVAGRADPRIRDSYGYSCLDWASSSEPLFDTMGDWRQDYSPTTPDTRRRHARDSVPSLVSIILNTQGQEDQSSHYHQLGHCLMFAGDIDNALIALQQQILEPTLGETSPDGAPIHAVHCNGHREEGNIKGSRFVCKTCADVDLCHICMAEYPQRVIFEPCRGHEFLEVSGVPLSTSTGAGENGGTSGEVSTSSADSAVGVWLRSLLD